LWVIHVAPTGSKASPDVRYAFNSARICASQRTDAMGHGTKPLAVVCSDMRTANVVAHGNVLSPITKHGISQQPRQRMIADMTSRAIASKAQQGYQWLFELEMRS
jgi:hypothetical protein